MRRKVRRIIVFIMLLTVILSTGTVAMTIYATDEYMNQENEEKMSTICEDCAEGLNGSLSRIKQATEIAAADIKAELKSLSQLEDSRSLIHYTSVLRREMLSIAQCTECSASIFFRIRPSYANGNTKAGIYYEKDPRKKTFVQAYETDLKKYVDETKAPDWYSMPILKGEPVWIGPYYREKYQDKVLAYVMPVYKSGHLFGIVGMEIDYGEIINRLQHIRIYKSGYAYLTTNDLKTVIYHPKYKCGSPMVRQENMVEYSRELKNGMQLVLCAPKSEVNEATHYFYIKLAKVLLVLMIILVVLVIFFHIVLGRSIRSEENTSEQIKSIANIYSALYMVDLAKQTYFNWGRKTAIENNFDSSIVDVELQMEHVVQTMVEEEHLEAMLAFTELSSLQERMEGLVTITQEFQDKKHSWERARFIRVGDSPDDGRYLFAVETIDKEKRRESQLMYLSETDLLTGINNRGAGETKVRSLLADQVAGVFMVMDVDHFKQINDTYGHSVGDKVIIEVAQCLKKSFRNQDVVMRLGGDEFAVYAVGVHEEKMRELIAGFLEMVQEMDIPDLCDELINVSIGAAVYDGEGFARFEDLYSRADRQTYISKMKDGNAVSFEI